MLTADQQHVEYTTNTLNQLGVLSINTDGAVAGIQASVRSALGSGVNKKIKRPTCEGRPEARETGYSVASSKGTALHWCFGLENEKRVLKVTNRQLTPIEIAHPNVDALTTPPVPGQFTLWTGLLDDASDFLAPGRRAIYDADLEPAHRVARSARAPAPRCSRCGSCRPRRAPSWPLWSPSTSARPARTRR